MTKKPKAKKLTKTIHKMKNMTGMEALNFLDSIVAQVPLQRKDQLETIEAYNKIRAELTELESLRPMPAEKMPVKDK